MSHSTDTGEDDRAPGETQSQEYKATEARRGGKRPACAVYRRGPHPTILLISGAGLWTPEGGCFGASGHPGAVGSAASLERGGEAALLAEINAEGGKMGLVARRRGVSESLFYNWRSARKAAAVAAGAPDDVQFVPVGTVQGTPILPSGSL